MAVTKANVKTVLSAAQGGVAATGTITVTTGQNAANNDTVTVNGVVFTFKTSGATGNQVNLGANAGATAAALQAVLAASTDEAVAKADYSVSTNVVTVTYKVAGTVGNAFTLAKSGTNLSVSAANLANGALTDATDLLTGIEEAKQDSDLEQSLIAVIGLINHVLLNTANPATDQAKCRKQRKLVKNVLDDLSGFVPTVADATDDRAAVAENVKDRAIRRMANRINPGNL